MGNNPSGLQEESNRKTDLENVPQTKGQLDVANEEKQEVHVKEKVESVSHDGLKQGGTDVNAKTTEKKAESKAGSGEYNEIQQTSLSDDKDNYAELTNPVSKEKTLDKSDNDPEKVVLTKEAMDKSSPGTKTSSDESAHQESANSKSDQDYMEGECPDTYKTESPEIQEGSKDVSNQVLAEKQVSHQVNAKTSVGLCSIVHTNANSKLDKEYDESLVEAQALQEGDVHNKKLKAKAKDEINSSYDSANDVGNISSTALVDPSGLDSKIIPKTEMVTIHEGASGDYTEENKLQIEESEIGKDRQGQGSKIFRKSVQRGNNDVTNSSQSEAKTTEPPKVENKLQEEKGEASAIGNCSEGNEKTSAKESAKNYAKAGANEDVERLSTESSIEYSNTCIYLQKSPSFNVDLTKEQKVEEPDRTPIQHHNKKASISISNQVNLTIENDKVADAKVAYELASDGTTPVEDKPVTYERNETEQSKSPSFGLLEEGKEASSPTTPKQEIQHSAKANNESFDSPSKGKDKRKSVSRLFSNCVGCGPVVV